MKMTRMNVLAAAVEPSATKKIGKYVNKKKSGSVVSNQHYLSIMVPISVIRA